MNCDKEYEKHCFTCNIAPEHIYLIATGEGMHCEMLSDCGERELAIKCPTCE